jgi:dTDP-4-dehydrorhamnose reductase
MSKKVLITGITGMLGLDVSKVFSNDNYNIYGIARNKKKSFIFDNNVKVKYFDLTNLDKTKRFIQSINPDIIVHCAANVNLRKCENNKNMAKKINSEVPGQIASFTEENTKFIYISTDSLFNGEKGNYKEEEETFPLNKYAESKLLGEKKVRENKENFIIIRTNIVGFHIPWASSLFEWALEKLINQNSIKGFNDTFFNPVTTKQLATIIKILVENQDNRGVINIGSKKHISKYEFLLNVADKFGIEKDLIQPASIEILNTSIKRPKNTTLNNSKIKKILNEEKYLDLNWGLNELKKDLLNQYIFARGINFE